MLKAKLLGATAGAEAALPIEDVFSTYLYTGTGAPQTIINNIPLSNFGVGTSTKFTGSQNLYRGDLVGNSDGKSFTFSAWIKLNTANGAIYSSDSTGSGVGFNVLYVSSQLRLRAYNSSGVEVASFDLSGVPFGVFFNLLISVDLTNSSNRYVYINDVAQTITWSTYTNTDIDFTRPDQRVGVRGTDYPLNGNLAHVFLDYTYRNLSVEANRRSFITANKGSTSVASLSALNPIVYLPLVSPYTFGQNLGTGGAFSVSGTPTFVNEGTEYVDGTSEGGLVWIKSRSAATDNFLFDTIRGTTKEINSNSTAAEATLANSLTSFNANGFSIGSATGIGVNAATYASWTFRQSPRFFDVVTYTGTGANRTISHDLGVVPGCIIVKRTDTTGDWQVYHRSLANTEYLVLNSTAAKATGATRWNSTTPTSSVFSLGTDATVNASGGTYVAYLFAHDPLGPSGDGSDGLIACGSYTGNGSLTGPVIDLGWEPQWLLVKGATSGSAYSWGMFDSMRGVTVGANDVYLEANNSLAEASPSEQLEFNARGFQLKTTGAARNASGETYIYIAIRRGPMREPTVGTEVFAPLAFTSTGDDLNTLGKPIDVMWTGRRNNVAGDIGSRLQGNKYLVTNTTSTEATFSSGNGFFWDNNTSVRQVNWWNQSGNNMINYVFRRAPGFFDVVAYTGTGANRTISHNLGAAPELTLVKKRSAVDNWVVYAGDATDYLILNSTAATADLDTMWNDTAPTSSVFSLGTNDDVNGNTATFIAYLFASLPGISKVGSYTGNGSSQTINCGFTTGARFVLIKRTDSTGDWYVWDTARGIVTGNDPHLSLNTTAAEVTTDDTIDPDNSGFIVNQVSATNVNVNAATYIFLAIA